MQLWLTGDQVIDQRLTQIEEAFESLVTSRHALGECEIGTAHSRVALSGLACQFEMGTDIL